MKKTKYGDYATWVTFEVLANYAVRLVFTDDVRRSASERFGHTPEGSADAFCFHPTGSPNMSYIVLPLNVTESTTAHEAWHIVNKMFHYVNMHDFDDEIVAYHLDHLVEKIYEFKNKIQHQEVLNDHRKGTAKSGKGRNRRR